MSRIGYKEIDLPSGVEISQDGNVVTVKGPKGTLSREISPLIKMTIDGNVVKFDRDADTNKLGSEPDWNQPLRKKPHRDPALHIYQIAF